MSKVRPVISIIALLLLLSFLYSSCKKDDGIAEVNMGYRYFPDQVGHWVVYQVDSIAWDPFDGSVDTFNYKIREVTESVFEDEEGRATMRIERYKQLSDTSNWVILDVWFANRTPSTVEKVEENIRFLKLIFPTEEKVSWNGNVFNALGEQEFRYMNVHQPYNINTFSFDSTLQVLQIDEQTLISRDFGTEVYATGVGMIYKKAIDQKIKLTGGIESGYDYSYTILSWGEN